MMIPSSPLPRFMFVPILLLIVAVVLGCEDDGTGPPGSTTFMVTIAAVSQPNTLMTDRAEGTVPLSPGVFVVFTGQDPAFILGQAADSGTELIAEDGFPSPALSPPGLSGTETSLLMAAANVIEAGTFASEGGADMGPAIFPALMGNPAESASFTFEARPGDRLQIETMFVQSNDWFYGFIDGGLELFSGDTPISGDVTNRLALYDAGTEQDTPPGTGPEQKPAQDPLAVNVGPDESVTIMTAAERHPDFDIPATGAVIRVTVTPQ